MAVFVLVPGGWLGGWAWRDVAAQLTRRGHRAVPVTLTGLGERRHLATPETGLGTHIQDIVQLLDHEELDQVVLVGHSYGIFPTVGAADLRADLIDRVVFLDAAVPEDGQTVLDALRDGDQRARLREQVAGKGEGWRFPPPEPDELAAWGSVDGMDGAALARMQRLGAAHPFGTFTEPLRLTGAVRELAASGVFCTANGTSIALARAYAAADPVRAARLADPRVTLFELPTGHYPMLSMPVPLAEVLIDAAAGRGQRLAQAG
jgi:pimeloyl-ACP methyl ester carboxylesterase